MAIYAIHWINGFGTESINISTDLYELKQHISDYLFVERVMNEDRLLKLILRNIANESLAIGFYDQGCGEDSDEVISELCDSYVAQKKIGHKLLNKYLTNHSTKDVWKEGNELIPRFNSQSFSRNEVTDLLQYDSDD